MTINTVIKIKSNDGGKNKNDGKENDLGAALDWEVRKVLKKGWNLRWPLGDKKGLVRSTFKEQITYENGTIH